MLGTTGMESGEVVRAVAEQIKPACVVAVDEGNRSEAEGAYKVAVKAVDKAVVKGLLHKNNAAHKKSAMTIKLNKLA